jgi:opacity protein-like surface antigen
MKKLVVICALAASCMAVSQNAIAAGPLNMQSAGVEVGMVSPENIDATFGFGVFADHGYVSPEIKIESTIGFWSKSEKYSDGSKASIRDISIGARGKYMFPTSSPSIRPFAGAGLGLHFLHAEVNIPAQGPFPAMKADDSTTKLGLDIGGGFEMPINPSTDFIAEAWYGIVSDVGQLGLHVGLAWQLWQ